MGLDEENKLVCMVVQAFLGLQTSNMRVVLLDAAANKVIFVLAESTPEDLEAIGDVMFEVEALTTPKQPSREVLVDASNDLGKYFRRGFRGIYRRREEVVS